MPGMTNGPVVLATLGDAGGIGPEIVARSLKHLEATDGIRYLIAGPRAVFEASRETAEVSQVMPFFEDIDSALTSDARIVLVDFNPSGLVNPCVGKCSAEAGRTDLDLAKLGVDLFKRGTISGFVFAPVNKMSLKMGGSRFEGYKAYIADCLGEVGTSAEINTIGRLWTTRVSSHVSIAEVPSLVTKDNVLETIRYFDRELRRFGYRSPKVAVSGLNPHNGDGGMFGREEIDHIGPAVDEARRHGLNVEGPYPPDTIFLTAQREGFLGIVSMYHDQCQIATKLLGFDEGVTYFGGLPFPITTPAHGTAYDIAGKGVASETPMANALKLMSQAVLAANGMSA